MGVFDELLQTEVPLLAIQFFQVFSRFECAMKRSGKYAKGDEQWVNPRWPLFADDLGADFFDEVVNSGHAETLIARPPNTQAILADGTLGWKVNPPVKNTRELIDAVRKVRDNLLHGGKYRDDGYGKPAMVEGSERDETLLRESLNVLAMALERNRLVHEHFGRI
ncbi:hypothetical protein [Cupriavidus plantarum]|uniref:hypothetical protein n=1 Tax=Cupriavidus plantarum TaxID=942865 RepID=UPI000EB4408B|nr:hypothetical protein [Cupriavidus plantarum]RLK44973.1 hypothetical protein C7417_0976 [Cupriavidus plantarum]